MVIVGQDPYPQDGVADGLGFSASPRADRIPTSLVRILVEAGMNKKDRMKKSSWNIDHWADQGVLLLNSVLTCPSGKSWGHASIGWQKLTSTLLRTVWTKNPNVVFLLWGEKAKRVAVDADINPDALRVITTSHPVASLGKRLFRNSGVFIECNHLLCDVDQLQIVWV